MPTYERLPRFDRDWASLDPTSQARFRDAATRFTGDLQDAAARPTAAVKAIGGAPGVLELAFAADAHATISVGRAPDRGPHVIWRRIGSVGARQRT